jgi:hypothetical protein
VVLQLAPDNRRAIAGEFMVRGESKEMRLDAAKLWPDANKQVSLVVTMLQADLFKFSEGGMWSDLVDEDELDAAYRGQQKRTGGQTPSPF